MFLHIDLEIGLDLELTNWTVGQIGATARFLKVLLEHPLSDILSVNVFTLQLKSLVAVTETVWPQGIKYLLSGP